MATARSKGHELADGRRLWLVRHGETVAGSSTRYWGATDVALADEGREQVAGLRDALREERFTTLVHSPLSRAAESARVVLGLLEQPPARIETHEGFREVNFGVFEGRTADEIAAEHPEWHAAWLRGEVEGYPGGETIDGFHDRVAAAVDEVVASTMGDVCIVVHRGVVKAILAHLLRAPRALVRRWPLDLGSLCVIVDGDSRWLLERYNLIG